MDFFQNILTRIGISKNNSNVDSPTRDVDSTDKLLPTSGTALSTAMSVMISPGNGAAYSLTEMDRCGQGASYRGYFYDAINRIAESVASTPFSIQDDEGEEIEGHPFYDVLNNPFGKPGTVGITARDLLYTMVIDLLLYGNSLWWINNLSPELSMIRPISPERIIPKVSKGDGLIESYEVNLGMGKRVSYRVENIVHVMYVDPEPGRRFIWGKSPVAAHSDLFDILMRQTQLEKDALEKGGLPAVLAKVDGAKTGEGRTATGLQRIREEIENRFFNRKEKVAVIDANLMDITTLETKLDQLQFTGIKEMTIREIASAFKIDPMFLGLTQTTNRAQADAAIYVLARYTLQPMLGKIEAQLNSDLIKPAYGDNVHLRFEQVVPQDIDQVRTNYDMAFRAGAVTPNEIRVNLLGLDPIDIPAMEKTYLPFALAPIDAAFGNEASGQGEPEQSITVEDDEETITVEDDDDDDEGEKHFRPQVYSPNESKIAVVEMRKDRATLARQRQQWLRLFTLAQRRADSEYTETLQRFFTSQIDAVEKRLRSWGERNLIAVTSKEDEAIARLLDFLMFNVDEATVGTISIMKEPIQQLMLFTGEAHITAMDLPIDFDTVAPEILELLETGGRPEGVFKFAKEINVTTDESLRRTLTEGLRKGETIADLSERIASVKADATGFRAVRIARTEINGGYNRAAVQTVKTTVDEIGGRAVKFWYTRGPAERDTHNANEAESQAARGLSLDQPYQANGLQHPGDPAGEAEEIINCQCVPGHIIDD